METQNKTKLKARIKDYFSETNQVQIWYDNQDSTFETLKLSDLIGWRVPDALKICEYTKNAKLSRGKYKIIDFIPDGKKYKFKPMDIKLLQRVSVLYRDDNWYTAFIDGYDEISRRHHVNYGDTSEWCWLHQNNVNPLNMRYYLMLNRKEKNSIFP